MTNIIPKGHKLHPTERKNFIGSKYYFSCGYQLTQLTKHGSKSLYMEHGVYHIIFMSPNGLRIWITYDNDMYKEAVALYKNIDINE